MTRAAASCLYLVLLGAILVAPALLAGQTVAGSVSETGSATVPEGVFVSLLDSLDRPVASTFSDARGRFTLSADTPGTYRVRAERIGYRTVVSDPIPLGPGDTIRHSVDLPAEAVSLEGMDVSGERRCRIRPEEGLELARVWEEARKALTGALWTREEEGYVYEVEVWGRELDPQMLLQRELERSRQVFAGSTFASLPAETLQAEGFVRETEEGFRYYGPDAEVLLSESFLDAHCFRLEEGTGEAEGLLGLAFQPISEEGPVDIRGVLWLDPATSRLRWVEYQYARLDLEVDRTRLGGRIAFDQLPGGSWIVREWRIRGPILHRTHDREEVTGQRLQLAGILEEGARTVRILDRDGALVLEERSGTVSGLVLDSMRSEPVEGARVEIVGTGRIARANAEGRFQFSAVPDGRYRFRMTHPRLDSMGIGSLVEEDDVRRGTLTALRFRVPSRGEVLARECGQEEGHQQAVVVGVVRDSLTARAIPGVTVEAISVGEGTPRAPEDRELPETAITRGDGTFVLCDLPRERRVVLRARAGEVARVEDTVRVSAATLHRVELHLALSTELDPARVVGQVTEHGAGTPVQGAEIRLSDEGPMAVSDEDGSFALNDVEPGAYVLRVEHLGYSAQEQALRVQPGETLRADISLAAEAIELGGIEVTVEPSAPTARMAGFHERMARGTGEFIPREEIDQRGSPSVTSLLDGRSGLQLKQSVPGRYVPVFRRAWRPSRGDCHATVYVNGHRIPDGTIQRTGIDFIPIMDVQAIELYRGSAQVPGEFAGSHAECGVVAIWTR